MTYFNQSVFTLLSQIVFEHALDDVNAALAPTQFLQESLNVSVVSFRHYLVQHHPMLLKENNLEKLAQLIYKKAVDDIAFQADIFGYLWQDIPASHQQKSCENAVRAFNEVLRNWPLSAETKSSKEDEGEEFNLSDECA